METPHYVCRQEHGQNLQFNSEILLQLLLAVRKIQGRLRGKWNLGFDDSLRACALYPAEGAARHTMWCGNNAM